MNKKLFFIILFYPFFLLSSETELNNDLIETVKAAKSHIDTINITEDDIKAIEKISELLKSKANVNARDNTETTSLLYAARNKNTHIIKLLLEHNADPNIQNNIGQYPLEQGFNYRITIKKKEAIITKMLLEHGADPNTQSKIGQPLKLFFDAKCLHVAYHDTFYILLDYSANIEKELEDQQDSNFIKMFLEKTSQRIESQITKNKLLTDNDLRVIKLVLNQKKFLEEKEALIKILDKYRKDVIKEITQHSHLNLDISGLITEYIV